MLSLLKELDQQEILTRYEKSSKEEKQQFLTHFNYIERTYGLSRHFDGLFLSQETHVAKPEEGVYRAVDEAIRAKEDEEMEVIFVDDLEGNRQAAEKYCGWRTFANIAALKEAKIC